MSRPLGAFAASQALCAVTPSSARVEASFCEADLAQLEAARPGDADAVAATALNLFIINNPLGETDIPERMIARLRSGEIAHDQFERTIHRPRSPAMSAW